MGVAIFLLCLVTLATKSPDVESARRPGPRADVSRRAPEADRIGDAWRIMVPGLASRIRLEGARDGHGMSNPTGAFPVDGFGAAPLLERSQPCRPRHPTTRGPSPSRPARRRTR